MRPKPDSHPEIHLRLAWYHFKKALLPNRLIPMPELITVEPNPEPGGFLDPLDLRWMGGKRPYVIAKPYRYDSELLGEIVTVPYGYRSDFASIPWLFRRILPKNGPYTPAAVVHDWLCDLAGSTGIDSATTHDVFHEAMEVLGVPAWKRWTMYRAVKYFGPRFDAKQAQRPKL